MTTQLHLGKMTGHEIAEWLGIKYSTYRQKRLKQLDKVAEYCDFEETRGGIIIKEIYCDTYFGETKDKELFKNVEKFIDETIIEQQSGYGTMVQVSKHIAQTNKYENECYSTLKYRVKKNIELLYDKTSIPGQIPNQGLKGWREYAWMIKTRTGYEPLTDEEQEYLNKLLSNWYNVPLDKVAMIDGLRTRAKEENMSFEEYEKQEDEILRREKIFKDDVIGAFMDRFNKLVVRGQKYYNGQNCAFKV